MVKSRLALGMEVMAKLVKVGKNKKVSNIIKLRLIEILVLLSSKLKGAAHFVAFISSQNHFVADQFVAFIWSHSFCCIHFVAFISSQIVS